MSYFSLCVKLWEKYSNVKHSIVSIHTPCTFRISSFHIFFLNKEKFFFFKFLTRSVDNWTRNQLPTISSMLYIWGIIMLSFFPNKPWFTLFCRKIWFFLIYKLFGVKFWLQKSCLCNKNNKYQVWSLSTGNIWFSFALHIQSSWSTKWHKQK